LRAHLPEQWKECAFQKIEWRRMWIVRSTLKRQSRCFLSNYQSWQDSLQHESRAPGCPDGEAMIPRCDFAGLENQFFRTKRCSINRSISNLRSRLHSGEVLSKQTGFGSASADVLHAEGLPRHKRQGERCAQDLSSPFAK
jgi:hypothetical protein